MSLSLWFWLCICTNDYKVIVVAFFVDPDVNDSDPLKIYSSRANSWKRMEAPDHMFRRKRALSNEALHWVQGARSIIAFDLANEEFRRIPFPEFNEDDIYSDLDFFCDVGVIFGERLCVSGHEENRDHVQFWVMMEYGVRESWTKLFQFSLVFDGDSIELHVFHVDSSIVVQIWKSWKQGESDELIRFSLLHNDVGDCSGRYMVEVGHCDMIKYDETLLWLNDHLGVEENVQRLGTQQEASTYKQECKGIIAIQIQGF